MRDSLISLINSTILYKYDLPNDVLEIPKTIFSTQCDKCYSIENKNALVEIIYNSIIEYSFNEFDIATVDYNDLHTIAFQERIRFNEDDIEETQLKYGFFGEVVLNAILRVYFNTEAIIAKGYFYNPLENSESKGYDAYHLIENSENLQLWFGETKFHLSYYQAVNDVLSKIDKSLSDSYLSKNLLAIRANKDRLNTDSTKVGKILNEWAKDPNIKIIDELNKHSIELVYPIFLLTEQKSSGYDPSIKSIVDYIKENHSVEDFDISIPYKVFFIFTPIKDVKSIKIEVLKWIKSKKPLLS